MWRRRSHRRCRFRHSLPGRQPFGPSGDHRSVPVDLTQEVRHVVGDHVDDVKLERFGGRKAHGGTEAVNDAVAYIRGLAELNGRNAPSRKRTVRTRERRASRRIPNRGEKLGPPIGRHVGDVKPRDRTRTEEFEDQPACGALRAQPAPDQLRRRRARAARRRPDGCRGPYRGIRRFRSTSETGRPIQGIG